MKHGDIFWVDFPNRNGHEQSGLRPAIVCQEVERYVHPTVLLIPFSSKLFTLRFDGTLEIHPSATNGLSVVSGALVFQMGSFDKRRIRDRIGNLIDAEIATLASIAKKLQKLP